MPDDERSDAGRFVADQMKALRERSGLTSEGMAQALSRELGRKIRLPSVSRWENGHQMPLSDILLAAMTVAGLPLPSDAPKDPRRAMEQELEHLRRQVELVAQQVNLRDRLAILPPAHRRRGQFLTVEEAANRLGMTRNGVYYRLAAGHLRAFVWMGRTVILPEDLEGAKPE